MVEEARTAGRDAAERARKAEALVAEYEADIGQVRFLFFCLFVCFLGGDAAEHAHKA